MGKGDRQRPQQASDKEMQRRWDDIFRKKKKRKKRSA
jgi:hypothetical protein